MSPVGHSEPHSSYRASGFGANAHCFNSKCFCVLYPFWESGGILWDAEVRRVFRTVFLLGVRVGMDTDATIGTCLLCD